MFLSQLAPDRLQEYTEVLLTNIAINKFNSIVTVKNLSQ